MLGTCQGRLSPPHCALLCQAPWGAAPEVTSLSAQRPSVPPACSPQASPGTSLQRPPGASPSGVPSWSPGGYSLGLSWHPRRGEEGRAGQEGRGGEGKREERRGERGWASPGQDLGTARAVGSLALSSVGREPPSVTWPGHGEIRSHLPEGRPWPPGSSPGSCPGARIGSGAPGLVVPRPAGTQVLCGLGEAPSSPRFPRPCAGGPATCPPQSCPQPSLTRASGRMLTGLGRGGVPRKAPRTPALPGAALPHGSPSGRSGSSDTSR